MRKFLELTKRSKAVSAVIAMVLCLSVVLSTFSGLSIMAGDAETWNGTVATGFASGTGSNTDPYIIEDGAQLRYLITLGADATVGKHYKLAKDIYLNDVSVDNWYTMSGLKEWESLEMANQATAQFRGTFDGNGHTVYGLYLNQTLNTTSTDMDKSVAAGLFPIIGGSAVIKNVGVDKAYISVKTSASDANAQPAGLVGALGGSVESGTGSLGVQVATCYAGADVKLVGGYVGLIGSSSGDGTGTVLTNCYMLLTGTAHTYDDEANRTSIISGNTGGAKYSGCYAANGYSNLSGDSVAKVEGGADNYVTGWVSGSAIKISNDAIKGEKAKTAMPTLDFDNVYMVTSSYPVLRVFCEDAVGADSAIWNGALAAPKNGTGTDTDPYIIETPAQLAYVVHGHGGENKFYKLANDIYLNDVTTVNWATGAPIAGATPIEWYSSDVAKGTTYNDGVFKGTLDGNGFTVYGLYYQPGNVHTSVGLIPCANGATVKNLRISKSFVSGGRWTAAIAGYGTDLTVSNVVIDETVAVEGYDAGNYYATADKYNSNPFTSSGSIENGTNFESSAVGTIVGYAVNSLNVSNVASYAKLKSTGFTYTTTNPAMNNGQPVPVTEIDLHFGGFIGTSWNTNISVSDSVTTLKPYDNKNGPNGSLTFTDVYATANPNGVTGVTVVTSEQMSGTGASSVLSGLDFDNVWATTNGYPTLKVYVDTEKSEYWSGKEVKPSKGTGAANDPIIISTPEEFAYIIKNGMPVGTSYKLEKDIYLNDITKIDWVTGEPQAGYVPNEWYNYDECGVLAGNFDGNGHMVYGLYYKDDAQDDWSLFGTGLFPVPRNGITISKLGVDYCYIKHPNSAGAFAGGNDSSTSSIYFDQCFAGENTTIIGHNAGAFVGAANHNINISNSYSLATTSFTYRGGGLVGEWYGNSNSTFTNVYNAKGKMGHRSPSSYQNVYVTVTQDSAIKLSAAEMQGLDVVTTGAMSGLGSLFQGTTTYPILTAFAPVKPAPEAAVWDGTTTTAPTEGTGIEDDPFIINNAEELAFVVSSSFESTDGKFYKLANDIYINSTDKVNWETGAAIDSYKINSWIDSPGFGGTLDGNGFTVKGLYYKNTDPKTAANAGKALFSMTCGDATIKNLAIDYVYIENNHAAAAFVGSHTHSMATKLTIEYCYVGENVTLDGFASVAFIGVADKAYTLDHVYNLGKHKANVHDCDGASRKGFIGLVGDFWGAGKTGASITNAYNATGPITNRGSVNSVSNIYCISGLSQDNQDKTDATVIDAEAMKGLNVFDYSKPLRDLNSDKAWEATNGYPILDIFSESSGNDGAEPPPVDDTDANGIWTGLILETFSDNTSLGTEDDPIIITSPGELALAIKVGGQGKYYKLANDIYLNDVSTLNWHTRTNNNAWFTNSNAAKFNGHIDGGGNIVYGIWYPTNATGYVGFIPRMGDGSVKNLGVRYSMIRTTSDQCAGGIIGFAGNIITVEQCFTDESVTVSANTSGGIVAIAEQGDGNSTKGLVIRNCYTKAVITNASSPKANGLLGDAWITAYEIYDSYSYGSKPYNVTGDGGKSSIYWFLSRKQEGGKWVNDQSYAKEGKTASDCFKDVYSSTGTPNENHIWTNVGKDAILGLDAAKNMPGLDFKSVWVAVDEGTPFLKIFAGKITGENMDLSADAEKFDGGKGTKKDPYLIKTVEQLRYLVQSETTSGKYYKLANDLYINDTSKKNWMTNAKTWYADINFNGFAGTLDGDGHYIYGLYVNQEPAQLKNLPEGTDYIEGRGAGLFPFASTSAQIRNLHIRNSYISGYANAGAFVGEIVGHSDSNLIIQGCSIDETVTIAGFTIGGFIGCGKERTADISYCYSTPVMKFSGIGNRCNALVGDSWGGLGNRLEQIYAAGYPIMRGNIHRMSAVYCDVEGRNAQIVSLWDMTGTNAKKNMPHLDWENAFYTVKGDTPHLKVIPYDIASLLSDEGKKGRVWSGKSATKFAGGSGTQKDPFIIETPEQFVYMLNQEDTLGKYYSITADLKINDTSKNGWEQNAKDWVFSSEIFRGTLLGNGHVVTGLYYNTSDSQNAGLIPYIGHNAIIEKLGIDKSTLINHARNAEHSYTGAFAGFIEDYDGYMGAKADYETRKPPVFKMCFLTDNVKIIGGSVGGFLGGGSAPLYFENCYSLAHLDGSYRNGAFYGDIWEGRNEESCRFENCFAATINRDPYGTGPNSGANAFAVNSYVDGSEANGAISRSLFNMQDERALTYMSELDYDNIWKIVKGGTPVLRCFPNAEQYSTKRLPAKVKIEFVTGDGTPCDPIEGYHLLTPIDLDKLPVPELYGYIFDGWYFYDTLDLKFNLTTFPNYNIHIYAKYVMDGMNNGFEGKMYDEYDCTNGADYFKPGVSGYNPRFVNGGLRSMRADGAAAEGDPMFLLNYEYPLEVGNKYDITFWMNTSTDGATGKVEFVHGNYPDANDEMIGYNTAVEYTGLKAGNWQQYRVTVTANAPYLFIRSTGDACMFFDDFQVVNLHEEGKLGDLIGFNPSDISTEPEIKNDNTMLFIILGIAGGVVLLAAIAIVVIVLVKKGKKAKAE